MAKDSLEESISTEKTVVDTLVQEVEKIEQSKEDFITINTPILDTTKTDTIITALPNSTSLEILMEVQQTRLEVAELTQKLTTVLAQTDSSKQDTLQIIQHKLTGLERRLSNIEQRKSSKKVEQTKDSLDVELQTLRQKYQLLDSLNQTNDENEN